jgi:hypothetical protein
VTVGKLCGSRQAVAVGDLYTISDLCDSWQVVCRWEALWPLASYIPLTSCVTVGKLWQFGEIDGAIIDQLMALMPQLALEKEA